MSRRAASLDSDGKSTVAIATENIPCGSMYSRNALSIAAGARFPSIRRDANNVSTTAFTLISPSPSVTGIISLKVCATAGSRQSITIRSRSSLPRSHGIGSRTWMTVPARIAAAYT